jgi:hypothetical protein
MRLLQVAQRLNIVSCNKIDTSSWGKWFILLSVDDVINEMTIYLPLPVFHTFKFCQVLEASGQIMLVCD